jgi:hypothetical protein
MLCFAVVVLLAIPVMFFADSGARNATEARPGERSRRRSSCSAAGSINASGIRSACCPKSPNCDVPRVADTASVNHRLGHRNLYGLDDSVGGRAALKFRCWLSLIAIKDLQCHIEGIGNFRISSVDADDASLTVSGG